MISNKINLNKLDGYFENISGVVLGTVVLYYIEDGIFGLEFRSLKDSGRKKRILLKQKYKAIELKPYVEHYVDAHSIESDNWEKLKSLGLPLVLEECGLYFSFNNIQSNIILFNNSFGHILKYKQQKVTNNEFISLNEKYKSSFLNLSKI